MRKLFTVDYKIYILNFPNYAMMALWLSGIIGPGFTMASKGPVYLCGLLM